MKALALFSGGLDSLLAIRVILEQGIAVEALHFDIGFESLDKAPALHKAADSVGVKLHQVDIKQQFFDEVLLDPQYGYGKYFNPCIDCHANMIRHAHHMLDALDAQFIISGEVVGQRPKSQRKIALLQVGRHSGAEGLILRPLSAKLLPMTIPEREGWVDREKLYAIEGRGRHVQLELAERFGLEHYESPAGGCLLTEENPSRKIRDMLALGSFTPIDAPLVNLGRYLILPEGARLIISRDEGENQKIEMIDNPKFERIEPVRALGPLALITRNASENDQNLAVQLVLAYCKCAPDTAYEVTMGERHFWAKQEMDKSMAQPYMLSLMK